MLRFLILGLLSLICLNRISYSQSTILSIAQLQKTKLYKSLDDALREPESVYRINLSNTEITSLPPEISTLTRLQSLNLSNNNITELPQEITLLKNLQFLNLENTNISDLPNLTSFKNLVTLDLDNMTSLNGSSALGKIYVVESLKELSMRGVYLMSLSGEIKKLKNLVKLNLSKCGLTEFNKEICELKNLKYLDLSFNEISSVPAQISMMKKLEELYIGGNRIAVLPDDIEELNKSLLILGLASADPDTGQYVANPVDKTEVTKIEKLLPKTKVIFVWN